MSEWAAQGDGGVTIPGGVQDWTWHKVPWSSRQGGRAGNQRLDMMIMEVFSNLNDSVILCKIISNES